MTDILKELKNSLVDDGEMEEINLNKMRTNTLDQTQSDQTKRK